jgi:hypothetical protein
MAHCNQCGIDWTPRVENPRACTRCKRYDWAEPKKGVGDAEIATGGSAGVAADTIAAGNKREDAGTAVIERAAGRLAHAANCGCFTCKPPKGEK